MGGLSSYNPLGGCVHELLCIKVNEITQRAGTTAAGVLTHTEACLTQTMETGVPWLQINSIRYHLPNAKSAHLMVFTHSTTGQIEIDIYNSEHSFM